MEKNIENKIALFDNYIRRYNVSKMDKKHRCKIDGIMLNDYVNMTIEHQKLWEEYAQVKDELVKLTSTMEMINERLTKN